MKKIYIFSVLVLFCLTAPKFSSAQCACTNCPQDLPDNTNQDFYINVIDQGGNCDLASNPLLGVNLKFTHEYLGDLTMTLTSPSGQIITLVGVAGYYEDTHYACGLLDQFECADTFDINFMDGVSVAWDSPTISQNAIAYYAGDFTPSGGGTLSSFTGNSCGSWKINVDDAQAHDIGEFIDFGLNFQVNSGIDCNSITPLPIELSSFKGNHLKDRVALSWETLTETNNRHFILERSADGIDFDEIGTVEGSGTSFEPNSYGFVDERPLMQHAYYRLIQEDFDGSRRISSLIFLRSAHDLFLAMPISVMPNPVNGSAVIAVGSLDQAEVQLSLSNLHGQTIQEETVLLEAGGNFLTRDFSYLTNGVYLISIQGERRLETFRFVKL